MDDSKIQAPDVVEHARQRDREVGHPNFIQNFIIPLLCQIVERNSLRDYLDRESAASTAGKEASPTRRG